MQFDKVCSDSGVKLIRKYCYRMNLIMSSNGNFVCSPFSGQMKPFLMHAFIWCVCVCVYYCVYTCVYIYTHGNANGSMHWKGFHLYAIPNYGIFLGHQWKYSLWTPWEELLSRFAENNMWISKKPENPYKVHTLCWQSKICPWLSLIALMEISSMDCLVSQLNQE